MIHQNGSDVWEDYSWIWRKEIDEYGENHNGDLRAHLVSAIRDSAIRLVESHPARLPELVTSFEKRRWAFFRRLALFLLQRFQTVAPDVAISRMLDRSYFDLSGPSTHGYCGLASRHSAKGTKRRFFRGSTTGPSFRSFQAPIPINGK